MLLKEKEKYELVMSHLQIMIKSYIEEIGKKDVQVAAVLRKKPFAVLIESPKDFQKLTLGKIYSKGWYVVYQAKERTGADFRRGCFFLSDKHLYTTSFLEHVRDMVKRFKGNSKDDIKCLSDLILWYFQVRQAIYGIIPKVYEVQKQIQG
ncbi:unnamed protein product [Lactuca saligna]|uniref:Uncharacterized protein n=1 Tax=Lactuca saligna TaxID=75948 RepID=A0AA35UW45_LACSI|nr:unnamed protein product [Lactuca saligna]